MTTHYTYLNSHSVPVKKDGESDADFQSRMDYFRKHDKRIATDVLGKVNFGFAQIPDSAGVIGNKDKHAHVIVDDGIITEDYTRNPNAGGSFSIGK